MLMPSLTQLPLEILFSVFCFLDIPDILRMRRVSRYMNAVSHCRDVWTETYRRADFIRPPGPFLSQSAHDLERALVPSFRLDWKLRHAGTTKQTFKPREIRYTGTVISARLVFGRFLLIASSEQVRCYDLNVDACNRKSDARIVYRSTAGTLKSFHCVSATDVEGRPFACVVLMEPIQEGGQSRISIYSVNAGEQSDVTLDLLHQFEHSAFTIRFVDLGPRVIVLQGPALYSGWHVVALDVHTRTQFLFPSPTGAAWEASEAPERTPTTTFAAISTSTHLLLARSFYNRAGSSTVLKAFALPPANAHVHPTALRHSHSGILPGLMRDVVLLHDATLDPRTQDTLIMIRVNGLTPFPPHSTLSEYGTLRLGNGKAHPTSDALGAITFELLGPFGERSQVPNARPSFNGTGRAFYTRDPGRYTFLAAVEHDVRGGGDKDSDAYPEAEAGIKVNARGKGKVVEYPCVLEFPFPRMVWDYDPYAGRVCLQSTSERVIEVLDLVV